jgi:hypothetical protein
VRALTLETGNAKAAALRPALERWWGYARASFDAKTVIGVLGLPAEQARWRNYGHRPC